MKRYPVWVRTLAEVRRVPSAGRSSGYIEGFGGGRYRRKDVSLLGLSKSIKEFEQFIPGSKVD